MRLIERILVAAALAAMLAAPAGSAPAPTADPPLPAVAPAPASAPEPVLYATAVSHLNTQWRWTVQDTIRGFLPATLRYNFAAFEKYPHYRLGWEGAFRYMLMKEYYPGQFARLKRYVAAGRWRPIGSMLDSTDVNLPSPESLFRQILYGNGFFRREFGQASCDIFLTDSFGYGWALPSVAAHAGLRGITAPKVSWGVAGGIPFNVGLWEGPDGAGVAAVLNPGNYMDEVTHDLSTDAAWLERILRNGRTSGLYADCLMYGVGDRGGAPKAASLEWVERSLAGAGPLRVTSAPPDQIFRDLRPEQAARLPRYRGELILTTHGTGTYTSQAAMKRWNRRNELLADAAERAAVAADWLGARPYPRERLTEAWVRFLWHQFHDDLPGTSIPQAYVFSWNDEVISLNQFAEVLTDSVSAVARGLDTRGRGEAVVVFNPLSMPRTGVVEARLTFPGGPPRAVRVVGPAGEGQPAAQAEVPSQVVAAEGDTATVLFLARVGPVGFAAYDVQPADAPGKYDTGLAVTQNTLESPRYAVRLNDAGDVAGIRDKATGRELLAAPARLEMLRDESLRWPAWEVQYADVAGPPRAVVGGTRPTELSGGIPFDVTLSRPEGASEGSRCANGVTATATARPFARPFRPAQGDSPRDLSRSKGSLGMPARVRIVENGPVRIALEVTREAEGSTFIQRIRLAAGDDGDRVDFVTEIDWRTPGTLLKAAFPLTFANPRATYDLGLGTIERPTNTERLYEVPAQQWADVTAPDGTFGVSILNDCKYGWDKPDDRTLRLTLLHTPVTTPESYADQATQDIGRHRLTYAVSGHAGDWRGGVPPSVTLSRAEGPCEGSRCANAQTATATARPFARPFRPAQGDNPSGVPWSAARLNQPLMAFQTGRHDGPLGRTFSLLACDNAGRVAVRAIKKVEDGAEIIVRVQELRGEPARGVRLAIGSNLAAAREVNGSEEPLGPATLDGGSLVFDLRPYQPRTFAVRLGPPPVKFAPPACTPMDLPYNLDVVAGEHERHGTGFDDASRALPDELVPPSLTLDGLTFRFGPTEPAANNAVGCAGQTVRLPDGRFNRIYFLAAAAGGDTRGTFLVGDKPVEVAVQDWAALIGQWDSRVIDHRVVGAEHLVPGFIRRDPIAWIATHRHTGAGRNEPYAFCYLFKYSLDLPPGTTAVTLPRNSRIRIMAMTAAKVDEPDTVPAGVLYD